MEWLKVIVIFLSFCVLKCSTMSLSEIEDFANFLEQTAQLDDILVKKGGSHGESDDHDVVSDYAWEESGKFEGDLILNERQRRLIVTDVAEGLSRNGLRDSTKRWPDNEVIFYIQKEHFTSDQVDAIQEGIEDLARVSCVKFRPYKKGDRDAVVIQGSRRGCFSQVGYQGGYQVLNLSGRHPVGRGCFRHGTVVHELLHTLGFYHMQSSPDRDDYIDVKWENIIEPAKHNFRKYNTFSVSDFGVGYDYDSVLHYHRRAFSVNGRDTLVPKQSQASIGQRVGLSDKDVKKLNKMYCDADSNNFDSVEKGIPKQETKKKNPINKPFEGHGIGYHQGKTVVIKLPTVSTHKLPVGKPILYVFNRFSKTQKGVSPAVSERFGIGEEVTYRNRPVDSEAYKKTVDQYVNMKVNDSKKQTVDYDYDDEDTQYAKLNEAINKNKNSEKSPPQGTMEIGSSGKAGDDLNEAFDRLGKIIKTHVYPSQTPDLDVYKTKLDYSEFYNPEIKFETESEIVKVDKAFGSSLLPGVEPMHASYDSNKEIINDDQLRDKSKEINKSTIEDFSDESNNNENLSKDFDSTYGTAYPLKQMRIIKDEKFVTPKYATLKALSQKHDYSGLYKPTNDLPSKKKNRLFGYVVPLEGEWHNDGFRQDNKKYDQEQYTYSEDGDRENALFKLHQTDSGPSKDSIFGRLPSGKQKYSLFGVVVPLTQRWYKLDYDPRSGPYLVEKPDSSEDYR